MAPVATPSKPPLRIAGVIGYPLQHSVSPAMHQAAFDALGLRVAYERWETPPDRLEWRIASLRHQGMLGASVTVPYKESVLWLVDELDDLARKTGAVNTVVNRAGRLFGYNTDAPGFLRALTEDARFEPKGKRVLLLGAGGAARAVGIGLLQSGVASLAIANRTQARAEALRQALLSTGTTDGAVISVLPWGALPNAPDLIVNATSIGMRHSSAEGQSPVSTSQISSGSLVYDLVYNPPETPLLKAARQAGARTLGGLPMLVYQGAMAFELWTGRKPPLDVMFHAARQALE